MWIVRVALRRPYTFVVLALSILILRPVVILRTPTDIFPNVDIPVIAVAFAYTGLNPEEIRAAFFPTVMLSAVAGLEGTSITDWLNWPSRLWAVGPSAVQTLLDAGRRKATLEAAVAGFDAAAADNRESALAAFQQGEDNLAALSILAAEAGQK